MPMTDQQDLTELLNAAGAGDEAARNRLFACVCAQLEGMIRQQRRPELRSDRWDTMALVQDTFVRLLKGGETLTKGRAYFFGAAAQAIKQLLWKRAQERQREKNAGLSHRVPVDGLDEFLLIVERTNQVDILELNEALAELQRFAARQHEVVMRRYFLGQPWKEIATQLGVSVSTVEQDWRAARAWLYGRLKGR